MNKILLFISILVFNALASNYIYAQNKNTVEKMITCLHELTESTSLDLFPECVSDTATECFDFDPPGEFGTGEFTAEMCFLSVTDQIKFKMNVFLESGWPNKETVGHQLRRIAIEYANKRSVLSCEYQRELSMLSYKPSDRDIEQNDINFMNRSDALCLFNYAAASYLTVVVLGKME